MFRHHRRLAVDAHVESRGVDYLEDKLEGRCGLARYGLQLGHGERAMEHSFHGWTWNCFYDGLDCLSLIVVVVGVDSL